MMVDVVLFLFNTDDGRCSLVHTLGFLTWPNPCTHTIPDYIRDENEVFITGGEKNKDTVFIHFNYWKRQLSCSQLTTSIH